jgi:subtilisin family serine protease
VGSLQFLQKLVPRTGQYSCSDWFKIPDYFLLGAYVSPARVREAITVGATDRYDYKAYFGYYDGRYHSSNYGTALDLFAPGKEIVSASHANSGYVYKSGTSMAAPHVAGVAAMYLQYDPNASPATVHNIIVGTATMWRLGGYIGAGSPNRLLDSLMQY